MVPLARATPLCPAATRNGNARGGCASTADELLKYVGMHVCTAYGLVQLCTLCAVLS